MEIEFFGLEEEAIDKMKKIVAEVITNYGCYEMDKDDQKLFDESIRTKHFSGAIYKGCRTIWIQESKDDDKININFRKKDMYLGNE
jgi:hypothetical protein